MENSNKTEKIRQLNDQLRQTGSGGDIVITPGIANLSEMTRQKVVLAI